MKKAPTAQPTWTYYFARKFSASRFEIVMRVFFSDFFEREFGVRLKNNLVMPHGRNHAIYHKQREWDQFAGRVYRRACGRPVRFRRYVRMIKATQAGALRTAEGIVKKPLKQLGWSELGALWKRWDRAHLEHFLKPIWIPFIIEPLLAHDAAGAVKKLERRRQTPGREAGDLEIVFSPEKPNAITEERIALLALALRVKRGTVKSAGTAKELKRHERRFGFIPCYDVIDRPWTKKDFQQELRALLRQKRGELEHEPAQIRKKFSDRPRQFKEILSRLRPNARERALLVMAHSIAFIKDERDDYRRRLSWTIQPLFREIARRARLPFRVPLYLIREEMAEWFRTERLPIPKAALRDRMRGYALVRKHGEPVRIFSGKAMREFLKRENFLEEQSAGEAVRGLIGNRGKTSGPARIVRTAHDLRRVQSGEILIAVTTNPDYVPAMRRCKAFVTDEGGMTSHAAIVSRELGIPCIVGTKIATRVFKDGDRVEVDATKGIVKKV